jgi:hypothetical protein
MPAIIGSYSVPKRTPAAGTVLEYAVNRTINGESRFFFVHMTKDTDGVWRIDGM